MSRASRRWLPLLSALAVIAARAQSVEIVDGNLYWTAGPGAARTQLSALGRDREATLSPDGRMIAFVRATPGELTETALGPAELTELRTIELDGRSERLRLRGRVAPPGVQTLADFRDLRFAPDSSRLYFESPAHVVQPAVHALDFADGDVRLIATGSLLEVLPAGPGPYSGHIIVAQHRYFVGGGSYDWAWLIAPDGREVGAVGDDDRRDPEYLRRREALRTRFSQSAPVAVPAAAPPAAQPARSAPPFAAQPAPPTGAPTACAALPPDTRIEPVGRFSNTRYTDEHAYGYDVLLWRAGRCLLGLLQYSPGGLAGDTPTGVLEQVDYEPATGALSFGAKLTAGAVVTSENGALVTRPSQDYFTFRGTLDLERTTLAGTFAHELRTASSTAQPKPEQVTLPRAASAGLYPSATTLSDWRTQLEPILRARGPKW